jgi:hypothetical protein
MEARKKVLGRDRMDKYDSKPYGLKETTDAKYRAYT